MLHKLIEAIDVDVLYANGMAFDCCKLILRNLLQCAKYSILFQFKKILHDNLLITYHIKTVATRGALVSHSHEKIKFLRNRWRHISLGSSSFIFQRVSLAVTFNSGRMQFNQQLELVWDAPIHYGSNCVILNIFSKGI